LLGIFENRRRFQQTLQNSPCLAVTLALSRGSLLSRSALRGRAIRVVSPIGNGSMRYISLRSRASVRLGGAMSSVQKELHETRTRLYPKESCCDNYG
jgi:hypothetical protein